MNTLFCGGDISSLGACNSRAQAQRLPKWKILKDCSTRITVLRRLGVKCRIEVCVLPRLAVGPTPVVSTQLEKSNPSVSTGKKNPPGSSWIWKAPAQVGPNHRELSIVEQRNGEGLFLKAQEVCNPLALYPLNPLVLYHILLAWISIQILKEDAPDESNITELVVVIAVTVFVLAHEMEGASHLTRNDLVRGVTHIAPNKQLLFLCAFGLLMNGANAQDQAESRKPEDPSSSQTLDYSKAAALWTLLAGVLTIGGVGVAKRMHNRWRPLPGGAAGHAANFDGIDEGMENSEWTRLNEDFTLWPECDDAA